MRIFPPHNCTREEFYTKFISHLVTFEISYNPNGKLKSSFALEVDQIHQNDDFSSSSSLWSLKNKCTGIFGKIIVPFYWYEIVIII